MIDKARPASHMGSWYTDDVDDLSKEIQKYLSSSKVKKPKEESLRLKALISPHAGYYYSGASAGSAFSHIDATKYSRAVVIGPSHYAYFKNCIVTRFTSLETPFGNLEVDQAVVQDLVKNNSDLFSYAPLETDVQEHSIEMELPFIKYVFKDSKISVVPIIIGECNMNSRGKIANALQGLFNDEKTLFVISSDFCHWGGDFDYVFYDKSKGEIWESIKYYDLLAVEIIGKKTSKDLEDYFDKYDNTICGRNAISVMMMLNESCGKASYDFSCTNYSQSEKVRKMSQNSVSYAGCVLYN